MDDRTFIIRLLKVLGPIWWPLFVLMIILAFRKQIKSLLEALAYFEGFGFKASFDKRLEKLAEKASEAEISPLSSDEIVLKEQGENDRLIKLAEDHPREAMTEAWIKIEKSMRDLLTAKGQTISKSASGRELASKLHNIGALDATTVRIITELRELRNQAVHLPDFRLQGERASMYITIAVSVADVLQRAVGH